MTKRLQGSTVEEKLSLNVRQEGSCLRWTGAHTGKGYGQVAVAGKNKLVHRLAYVFAKGEVPAGLEIDHRCRTRDCVNADHLEAVTHAENISRRKITPITHCPHGHEYTPENSRYLTRRGYRFRECRTCHNAKSNASRRKRA